VKGVKMRKTIIVLSFALVLLVAGCEEYLLGAGAGAAGMSALNATEKTLATEGQKLEAERQQVIQEVQDANTPEQLTLAEQKLEVLDKTIFANKAALQTIQSIQAVAGAQGPDRQDAVAVGVVGLIGFALEEILRRRLKGNFNLQTKKYDSMKAGQARLKIQDPKLEETLYALIGAERRSRGL
jgi:cell division protein FtsB